MKLGWMVGLVLVSCAAPVAQPSSLEQAQARWSARGFQDYSFTYRRLCFCLAELTRSSRVEVRAGQVTRVTPLEGQSRDPLPARLLPAFNTVDQLLAQLERDLPLDPGSVFERVEATYHPTLGYPTSVAYLEKPIVADAAFSYTLGDLTPLEPSAAGGH